MKRLLLRITTSILVMLVLVAESSFASSKSDLAKEKRWEEQIVPALMVGEDVKLKANGVEFLALYAEASTDSAKGGVILLHGIGVHPAWPDVIEPLRMQLPDNGWHTLSLQMPILKNEAEGKDYPPLFPEVPSRIQAGVDFLKKKGIKNIIISAHSMGATMATYYLSTKKDPSVSGFAMLSGGPGYPQDPPMNALENFKKIKNTKIIDIYGSEDNKPVLEVVKQRKMIGEKIHTNNYQNLQIKGANHFYQEKQDELVAKISAWLDKSIAAD